MARARNNRADVAEVTRQGEVGRLLRETRETMGVDLRAASDALCIRFAHLSAIEEGRYGDLPGPAYAVGFVRTYADYLRLDGEEIVRRFKEESAIEPQNDLAFPTPVNEGGLPSGALLLAAVLLAGGVYGAWHFTVGGDRSVVEMIQDVPERLTALMPKRDEAPPTVVPDTAPAAAPAATAPVSSPASSSPSPVPADEPRRFLDQETVAARLAEAQSRAADAASPGAPGASPDAPPADAPAADATAGTGAAPPDAAAAQVPPSASGPDATRPGERAVVVVDEPPPPEDEAAVVPPEASGDMAESPEPGDAAAPGAAPVAPAPVATAEAPPAAAPPAPAAAPAATAAVSEPNSTPVRPPAKAVVEQSAQAAGDPVPAPMPTAADNRAAPPAPALQEAAAPTDGRVYWPENGDARVVLKAKADSWVQIRDHDSLLLTRLLKRGDTLMVPNRDGLTLMTGNAGGMVIEVDGKAVAPLGHTGEVRRGVSLDAESLKGAAARTN